MDHGHEHLYRSSGGPSSYNTQNVAGEGHARQNNNHGPNQQAHFGQGHQINDHRSGTHYHGNVTNVDRGANRNREDRDKILKDLHKSPYSEAKDRNPVRVAGTCEWFVHHALFQQWRDSQTSNMLWVSADPGSGKSVLAKHLIDTVLRDSNSTICYFFFKDDFEDQRSATNAVSCILHQLFTQRRELFSDTIIDRFNDGAGFKPGSTNDLWDILTEALSTKKESASQHRPHQHNTGPAHSIVCIIDAFDECSTDGQSAFSDLLCEFYRSVKDFARASNFNLKFLITSRPYNTIRKQFHRLSHGALPMIHLDGDADEEKDKIQDEIGIFIEAKVHDFGSLFMLRRLQKATLLKTIRSYPNRTYLWVYLMLDWVRNELDKDDEKDITEITSRLPPSIDSAYELILAKSLKPEKAKKLLHIIVAATRPLSLEEMHLALAIEPHHEAYDRLGTAPDNSTTISAFDERWFREHVRNLCGLFVTIVDSKLYLLHQTAKQFLVSDTADATTVSTKAHSGSPPNGGKARLTWKSSLQQPISHEVLFHICAWHLNFDAFKTRQIPISTDVNFAENRAILSEYMVDHPFLGYSARNWSHHFSDSQLQEDTETMKSLIKIPDTYPDHVPPWFVIFYFYEGFFSTQGFTSLMIASYFGLAKTVEVLLQEPKFDVNAKCKQRKMSALSLAVERSFDNVVEVLLACRTKQDQHALILSSSKTIEVDSRDQYGQTPLYYASASGQTRIARMLLDAGAKVDAADKFGRTALLYAAMNGKDDVVKRLLRAGANVDTADKSGKTALLYAAINEKDDVVERLLRAGANVDMANEFARTALLGAMNGKDDVVERLLRAGVNVDIANKFGRTILLASMNMKDNVERLLRAGTSVDAVDRQG